LRIRSRTLPMPVWRWSDDTHMTLSVVENLAHHQGIDRDSLAASFVGATQRTRAEATARARGDCSSKLATRPWQEASVALFKAARTATARRCARRRSGPGSPVISMRRAQHGRLQSEVTHATRRHRGRDRESRSLLRSSQPLRRPRAAIFSRAGALPRSEERDGRRIRNPYECLDELDRAIQVLGTGRRSRPQDTVRSVCGVLRTTVTTTRMRSGRRSRGGGRRHDVRDPSAESRASIASATSWIEAARSRSPRLTLPDRELHSNSGPSSTVSSTIGAFSRRRRPPNHSTVVMTESLQTPPPAPICPTNCRE